MRPLKHSATEWLPLAMMFPVLLVGQLSLFQATFAQEDHSNGEEHHEEGAHPYIAILFAWFSQALGVVVFYLLSRYLHAIPYTAVMFILGTCMGVGAARLGADDQLTESIIQWININSEVLLLVFLPGLIFKDAYEIDVHLFYRAFWQLVTMAFPMVLAGTALTALVGFYVLPYSWSWNLSMTFGSILAATDPVSVSALLKEVGAPPRLKIHISGESLLNDGSAYVFFSIFSALFLTELNIAGLGREFTVGQGFAFFFRLALGGMALGIGFGLGLVFILYYLNKRLNPEENVLQVAATATVAYLTYYVGDVVAGVSGLIATVFCGVITKALGYSMINDHGLMDSFWKLVEHLLNTLLFALAGAVWGGIISNVYTVERFSGQDWGYMILVYVLVNAIRFFLMGCFYPLISNIGLKSRKTETIFMSYAGLRGAVGIALAISLDSEVHEAAEASPDQDVVFYQEQTRELFAIVGGVAFLTLLINGSTAGPVLMKLGLAASPESRTRLLEDFEKSALMHILDSFVRLLSEPRFHNVDFAVVRHHVHSISEITLDDLKAAVLRNKDCSPNLENVLPYFLESEGKGDSAIVELQDLSWAASEPDEPEPTIDRRRQMRRRRTSIWNMEAPMRSLNQERMEVDEVELRKLFVEILRSTYNRQIQDGELDGREGVVTYVLLESLDFALEQVSRGKPLNDWELVVMLGESRFDEIPKVKTASIQVERYLEGKAGKNARDDRAYSYEFHRLRVYVHRALAFVQAHETASDYFRAMFSNACGEFRAAEKVVLDESAAQVDLAEEYVKGVDQMDLEIIQSHAFCTILLNRNALYVEQLHEAGILTEREATHYVEEIEKNLDSTRHCTVLDHPGQLSKDVRSKTYSGIKESVSSHRKPEESLKKDSEEAKED